MFQRMNLPPAATEVITIAAFCFALSIFVAFAWRAVRMRRSDITRLAQMPFETATPESRHEPKSDSSSR
jgi:hypothetical protein